MISTLMILEAPRRRLLRIRIRSSFAQADSNFFGARSSPRDVARREVAEAPWLDGGVDESSNELRALNCERHRFKVVKKDVVTEKLKTFLSRVGKDSSWYPPV